jgi:hypothetical protein
MGFTTAGYIPRKVLLEKVTGEPNTGTEQLVEFQKIVDECAGDSLDVSLWELISDLQMWGLYNYIDVVAKIHGELSRPQYVKDFYTEQLETVLKYMQ